MTVKFYCMIFLLKCGIDLEVMYLLFGHTTLLSYLLFRSLNNIDDTGKIKFTIQIADEVNGLEFLDLKIKCLNGKLLVDAYCKPTNSFTYVLPSTCYPMKNINKVPQGIALRLRRICDTTEKYESRADEYKNYLLARDYKPSLVDKQFEKISQISREDARKSKAKSNQVSKIKFVTKCIPMLGAKGFSVSLDLTKDRFTLLTKAKSLVKDNPSVS